MASPNDHIVEYLRYYADPSRELDYAVMLDAPWGSGKTYLIKAFLEDDSIEHLYVSLFGVTSTTQIDDELFRQMHPVLGSKYAKGAGRLLKGIVKGHLKIDFGKEGEGTADVSIPGIDLKEFMSGPKSRLIVFDDLERVGMKIKDVLGYINAFVEHDGVKAVVIANGAEIEKLEERYGAIKEKLIGQTMFVRADVEAALPAFFDLVADVEVRALLDANKEAVLAIHRQSETNNLRILKQSIWDFERIAEHLTPEQRKKPRAVRALIQQALALAIEIKAGRLKAQDMADLGQGSIRRLMLRNEGGELMPADEFEKRYPEVPGGEWIIPPEELGAFLIQGRVDADALRERLDQSRLFGEPSSIPAWRRAWSGFSSDDDAYEAALAEMEAELGRREIVDQHVLYHVFGIRLEAADIGALPISRAKVVEEGKAYIDYLAANNKLDSGLDKVLGTGDSVSYDGLGYQERDTPEFKEMVKYYVAAAEQATAASYSSITRALLAKGAAEPDELIYALTSNQVRTGKLHRVPILASIPPAEFVDIVMGYGANAQVSLFQALKGRYEWNALQHGLSEEAGWLREVRDLLVERAEETRPMTRCRLKAYIETLLDPLLSEVSPIGDLPN